MFNSVRVLCLSIGLAVCGSAANAATFNSYGDVSSGLSGYTLTADPAFPAAGYAGIYFHYASPLLLSSVTTLSADYTWLTPSTYGGGSPRFTLFDSSNASAYIYFGTPTGGGTFTDPATGSTGNYATDSGIRIESNGFGGLHTAPLASLTFAQFVAAVGSTGIMDLTIDVDSSFVGKQQMLVSDFNINGEHFALAAPAPEPSTWAMMILGFAGVGFMAYRRRSRAPIAA